MKKLKDLMNRQFATVRPDAEVREVARLMKKQNVGFIPVCDEQRIHGIITDRDIVMRVLGDKMDVGTVKARDIMSKDVFWCFDDDSFETAAKLMQQHRVRRLLVLDHDGQLCGILSMSDIAYDESHDRLAGETLRAVAHPEWRARGGILRNPWFQGGVAASVVAAGVTYYFTQRRPVRTPQLAAVNRKKAA